MISLYFIVFLAPEFLTLVKVSSFLTGDAKRLIFNREAPKRLGLGSFSGSSLISSSGVDICFYSSYILLSFSFISSKSLSDRIDKFSKLSCTKTFARDDSLLTSMALPLETVENFLTDI
jgi:hypothetical protein